MKLEILTVKGPAEFDLIPTDVKRVRLFRQKLSKAVEVVKVLESAKEAFEEGRAEYSNAARRLNKLLEEGGKADFELFATACSISQFFRPDGLQEAFGEAFAFEDLDQVTQIANEATEKLLEAGQPKAKVEIPPSPLKDPTSKPAPEDEPEKLEATAAAPATVAVEESAASKTE